ncbi:MAG: hypothetical protein KAS32_13285, partial [Candidatus Peribacteraceae bacterium]|nr:hypothetical protein [Candidatus Peribacteraceae bacterium]
DDGDTFFEFDSSDTVTNDIVNGYGSTLIPLHPDGDRFRKGSDGDFDNDGFDLNRDGIIDTYEMFTNYEEYWHLTDPTDQDSEIVDRNGESIDGDGMMDGWEVLFMLNPMRDDSQENPDFDNCEGMILTNEMEYQMSSSFIGSFNLDPRNWDSDGDGMLDGWEIFYDLNPCDDGIFEPAKGPNHDSDNDGWDANSDGEIIGVELFTNYEEYIAGSHPKNSPYDASINSLDSDNDGMLDGWEIAYRLHPAAPDSGKDNDLDGLNNREEYQNGTHPDKWDTDGDGMPDGWEVEYKLDPIDNGIDWARNKDNSIKTPNFDNGADGDPDEEWIDNPEGKTLTNLQEYRGGSDPKDPDSDDDGMDDAWEVEYGTQPKVKDDDSDPDGDGLTNYEEYNRQSPATGTPVISWESYTYPMNADSDNDGIDDGVELSGFFPYKKVYAWNYWTESGEIALGDTETELPPGASATYHIVIPSTEDIGVDYKIKIYSSTEIFPDIIFGTSPNEISPSILHVADGYITESFTLDAVNIISTSKVEVKITNPSTSTTRLAFTSIILIRQGGLEPGNEDSDADGVIDGDERDMIDGHITFPLNYDTDGDMLSDGYEIRNGLNPNPDYAKRVNTILMQPYVEGASKEDNMALIEHNEKYLLYEDYLIMLMYVSSEPTGTPDNTDGYPLLKIGFNEIIVPMTVLYQSKLFGDKAFPLHLSSLSSKAQNEKYYEFLSGYEQPANIVHASFGITGDNAVALIDDLMHYSYWYQNDAIRACGVDVTYELSHLYNVEESPETLKTISQVTPVSEDFAGVALIPEMMTTLREGVLEPNGYSLLNGGSGSDFLDDDDSDGLSNWGEAIYGTSHGYSSDSAEGDSLYDGDEIYIYRSNPKDADTDNDGLLDNFETSSQFTYTMNYQSWPIDIPSYQREIKETITLPPHIRETNLASLDIKLDFTGTAGDYKILLSYAGVENVLLCSGSGNVDIVGLDLSSYLCLALFGTINALSITAIIENTASPAVLELGLTLKGKTSLLHNDTDVDSIYDGDESGMGISPIDSDSDNDFVMEFDDLDPLIPWDTKIDTWSSDYPIGTLRGESTFDAWEEEGGSPSDSLVESTAISAIWDKLNETDKADFLEEWGREDWEMDGEGDDDDPALIQLWENTKSIYGYGYGIQELLDKVPTNQKMVYHKWFWVTYLGSVLTAHKVHEWLNFTMEQYVVSTANANPTNWVVEPLTVEVETIWLQEGGEIGPYTTSLANPQVSDDFGAVELRGDGAYLSQEIVTSVSGIHRISVDAWSNQVSGSGFYIKINGGAPRYSGNLPEGEDSSQSVIFDYDLTPGTHTIKIYATNCDWSFDSDKQKYPVIDKFSITPPDIDNEYMNCMLRFPFQSDIEQELNLRFSLDGNYDLYGLGDDYSIEPGMVYSIFLDVGQGNDLRTADYWDNFVYSNYSSAKKLGENSYETSLLIPKGISPASGTIEDDWWYVIQFTPVWKTISSENEASLGISPMSNVNDIMKMGSITHQILQDRGYEYYTSPELDFLQAEEMIDNHLNEIDHSGVYAFDGYYLYVVDLTSDDYNTQAVQDGLLRATEDKEVQLNNHIYTADFIVLVYDDSLKLDEINGRLDSWKNSWKPPEARDDTFTTLKNINNYRKALNWVINIIDIPAFNPGTQIVENCIHLSDDYILRLSSMDAKYYEIVGSQIRYIEAQGSAVQLQTYLETAGPNGGIMITSQKVLKVKCAAREYKLDFMKSWIVKKLSPERKLMINNAMKGVGFTATAIMSGYHIAILDWEERPGESFVRATIIIVEAEIVVGSSLYFGSKTLSFTGKFTKLFSGAKVSVVIAIVIGCIEAGWYQYKASQVDRSLPSGDYQWRYYQTKSFGAVIDAAMFSNIYTLPGALCWYAVVGIANKLGAAVPSVGPGEGFLALVDRLYAGRVSTADLTEMRDEAFEYLAERMMFTYCFVDRNSQIFIDLGTGE